MSNVPALSLRRRMVGLAGSGTVATLILLLFALWVVFAITIGDRFFSVSTLQSMAFQMPELGILSLAMMLALLSGGLNLSIIATANLSGLTIAFLLTRYIPGSQGLAWVGIQVFAIAAGFAVAPMNSEGAPFSSFPARSRPSLRPRAIRSNSSVVRS